MKITIEHYGKTFTAEFNDDEIGHNIVKTFVALMVADGYPESLMEQIEVANDL